MIVLLSPAKKLDFSSATPNINGLQPYFHEEAKVLMGELKQMTPRDLSVLMRISEKLSLQNVKRYATSDPTCKPAIFAFQGDTYRGLMPHKFSLAELNYAQEKIRILSGLFGVLAPFDLIFPHRLEMGTNLAVKSSRNLYEFWQNKVCAYLNGLENKILINCASAEYFKVVKRENIKAKIITPIFLNGTGERFRNIGIFAKRARGLLAHFIIKEKINDLKYIPEFNYDGYSFDKSQSSEQQLVFKRINKGREK